MEKPETITFKVNGKEFKLNGVEIEKATFDAIYNEIQLAGMAYNETEHRGVLKFDTERLKNVLLLSWQDAETGKIVTFIQSPGKTTAHLVEKAEFDEAAGVATFTFVENKKDRTGKAVEGEYVSQVYKLKTGEFGKAKRKLNAAEDKLEEADTILNGHTDDAGVHTVGLKELAQDCIETNKKILALEGELDTDFDGKGKGLRTQLAEATAERDDAVAKLAALQPKVDAYTAALDARQQNREKYEAKKGVIRASIDAAGVRTYLEADYRSANLTNLQTLAHDQLVNEYITPRKAEMEETARATLGEGATDAEVEAAVLGVAESTLTPEIIETRVAALVTAEITEAKVNAEIERRVDASAAGDAEISRLQAELPTLEANVNTTLADAVAEFGKFGLTVDETNMTTELAKIVATRDEKNTLIGEVDGDGLAGKAASKEKELQALVQHRDNDLIPNGLAKHIAKKFFNEPADKRVDTFFDTAIAAAQADYDAKKADYDAKKADYDTEKDRVLGLTDKIGFASTDAKFANLENRMKGLDPIEHIYPTKLKGGVDATIVTTASLHNPAEMTRVLIQRPMNEVVAALNANNDEIIKSGNAIKIFEVDYEGRKNAGARLLVRNSSEYVVDPATGTGEYKDSSTHEVEFENRDEALKVGALICAEEGVPQSDVYEIETGKEVAAGVVSVLKKVGAYFALAIIGIGMAFGHEFATASKVQSEAQQAFEVGYKAGESVDTSNVSIEGTKWRADLVTPGAKSGYQKAGYKQQDFGKMGLARFLPFVEKVFNKKFGLDENARHGYVQGSVKAFTKELINKGYLPGAYDDQGKLVPSPAYLEIWKTVFTDEGEIEFIIKGTQEALEEAAAKGVSVTAQDYNESDVINALTEATGKTYTSATVATDKDGNAVEVYGFQAGEDDITVCVLGGNVNDPIADRIANGEFSNYSNSNQIFVDSNGNQYFGMFEYKGIYMKDEITWLNEEHTLARQDYLVRGADDQVSLGEGEVVRIKEGATFNRPLLSAMSVGEAESLPIDYAGRFENIADGYMLEGGNANAHNEGLGGK